MAQLRYTGEIATTFMDIGEVEPGAEFSVSDHEAERYTRRADVVYANVPAGTATLSLQASDIVPITAK